MPLPPLPGEPKRLPIPGIRSDSVFYGRLPLSCPPTKLEATFPKATKYGKEAATLPRPTARRLS